MQNKLPNEIKKVWLAENILEVIGTMIGFGIVYFVLITFVAKNLVNLFLMIWAILFALVIVFDIVQILLIPYVYNFWTYQITGEYVVLHKGYAWC
ncbi:MULTISPECIES: hypothetical protein [Lactobacillus]|uniref:hypothetical protein n=1 Tax=Lactobacillus TaxID=1578 RepID=UPI001FCAC6C3|nr:MULTISPECIES: hypothetical protein [Lactobacillus]